jgi:glycosyltransferase involved in cell wall biosynthesis
MKLRQKGVTVIIPAYNEERTVGDVVRALMDDGSSDRTAKVAKDAGARVICHGRNMGYLEALRTGFKQAAEDIVVTMDADGQHSAEVFQGLWSRFSRVGRTWLSVLERG